MLQKIIPALLPLLLISCNAPNSTDKFAVSYFRDSTAKLEYKDAIRQNFTSVPDARLFAGNSADAIWLKVEPKQAIDEQDAAWFLEVYYSQLDHVDFYQNNGRDVFYSGDNLPYKERPIDTRNFMLKLNHAELKGQPVFIRSTSSGTLWIPVRVLRESEMIDVQFRENIWHGAYFGLMGVIAAFNLVLAFSFRDRMYAYYSLYAIFSLLSMLSLTGYSFQLFWPNQAYWASRSFLFFGMLGVIVASSFLLRFLFLKDKESISRKSFRLLQITAFGSCFLAYLYYTIFLIAAQLNMIFFTITVIIVASNEAIRGKRAAAFILISWSFVLLGFFLTVLSFRGMILGPDTAVSIMMSFSALETILLSFALGDRFNQQKKDSLEQQIRLTDSYARFVPKQFLTFLKKDSITEVQLGDSVQREMTVLFSDVRSFTTLSESMSPQESFDFINALLKRIGPVIRKHNGFIDKYIGDAIMALFPGTPEDAILASIEIRQLLAVYNARRAGKNMQPIKIGIGIHTGRLMLGTIGEAERMEGTVISDTVNLASRLESLTRHYGVTTIVSERTLFGQQNPDAVNYRIIDHVKVKGKDDSVAIIEILDGEADEQLQLRLATRAKFERALQAYQGRDFDTAFDRFSEVLQVNPVDSVARMYAGRIAVFREKGLPPDWDGVQVMDNK
ncbi:MAG: hypothetical protein KDK39_08860 [Leptospiraceae bacterium]|nr:hypothetical protein [Leptospiraceae bacterium]